MTKEITKANILQEMQDKFKLRELVPETFRFSEEVVPVYSIEQHIQRWEVAVDTASVTAGPLGYLMFYVPEDQNWIIRGYNVIFMAAGAYTVTGVYVNRMVPTGDVVYLDMTAGQTVSYAVNLPVPIKLTPGQRIYVYVDGYTSTADLRLYLDVMKENIR